MSNSVWPYGLSPPDSSVHRILQARTLEWVFMPSSRGSSWPRYQTRISCLLYWQVGFLPLVALGKPSMEYYSAIKRMKSCHLQQHMEWCRGIMISEMSESIRQILYDLTYMWNLKTSKNKQMNKQKKKKVDS